MNTNTAFMCAPSDHEACPSTPSKPTTSQNGSATPSTRSTPPNDPAKNKTNLGNALSQKIDLLPRYLQFLALASCVFFFFGIHNVLQEAMINTDGFRFGVMLGWMEVLGVTLCSAVERSSAPCVGSGESRRPRSAPLAAYPPLTVCLVLSSSLAARSLDYINFPTKVVFRSCKLLPTMIVAVLFGNAERFTAVEVASALSVCLGLITFAAGDWNLSKPRFHPFGLALVAASVFADAVLPNAQERLFRKYDASKSEVMFYTNVFTLGIQTGSAVLSGDLAGMLRFVLGRSERGDGGHGLLAAFRTGDSATNKEILLSDADIGGSSQIRWTFLTYVAFYILISHIAVSAHTAVVKKFGGVAAVFVGTARKGMTLVLSFVLFPKESNWRYAVGATLVLGGLAVASLEKQKNKRNKANKVAEVVAKTTDYDQKYLVPALPFRSEERHEAMEEGQSSSKNSTEFRPLVNNGPERRR